LQRFSQSTAAAELAQILEPAKLKVDLPVVHIGELVIEARGEDVSALRRADAFDERCNSIRGN
jgi:hypothetical protein